MAWCRQTFVQSHGQFYANPEETLHGVVSADICTEPWSILCQSRRNPPWRGVGRHLYRAMVNFMPIQKKPSMAWCRQTFVQSHGQFYANPEETLHGVVSADICTESWSILCQSRRNPPWRGVGGHLYRVMVNFMPIQKKPSMAWCRQTFVQSHGQFYANPEETLHGVVSADICTESWSILCKSRRNPPW